MKDMTRQDQLLFFFSFFFVFRQRRKNAVLEKRQDISSQKGAKKKERVRFRALLLHARREYETKARSIYLRSAAIGREC